MKRSSSDETSPPSKAATIKESLPIAAGLPVEDDTDQSMLKPAARPTEEEVGGSPQVTSGLSIPGLGLSPEPKRFPDRLYQLLNADAAPGSLYWLPGGKAFAIDQATFASEVLDRHFQATKFASFIRRLHKWGFRRETRGFRKEIGPELSRSVIAFCHDLFQKDLPDLVKQMEEIAKKPQANSTSKHDPQEAPSPPQRKRRSSAGSHHSDSSVGQQQDHSNEPKPQKKQRASATIRAAPAAEQKEDTSQLGSPAVASYPTAPLDSRAINLPAERSAVPPRELSAHQILQNVGQQLLLQNMRNSSMQSAHDRDSSLRWLFGNQQDDESHLQRSIITASLSQQQQQQLQQQERQRQVALVAAAASTNQALLDAAATERLLQLRRSLAGGPLALPQTHLGLQSSLFAPSSASRAMQQRPSLDSNSQLRETLLLLELQRQHQAQQEEAKSNQSPHQNRQFPPFG